MTATAVANPLPWAGQPNVTCTLTRRPDGMILGRCTVNMPAGGEPVVIEAKVSEKDVMRALMQRYAPKIQQAKASGMAHAGLFGFIKKIAKVAKKVARGKVIGKLVGGFKKVMSIPVLGPALGAMVPALGVSYLALKGAEKLGLSPFQARKLAKIKNPRVRAAIAKKLRGRLAMVNRRRWQNAQRRQGIQPQRRRGGWGRAMRGGRGRGSSSVQRALALLRRRGIIAGDAAVAGATVQLSNKLLRLANSGDRKARWRIAQIHRKAQAGDPNAIRGRRILIVCAKALKTGMPKRGLLNALTTSGADGGEFEGDYGASSPFYDISGDVELDSLLNEEDGSIAGDFYDIGAEQGDGDVFQGDYGASSPFYDISGAHTTAGALDPNSPMSLHNYYTIMGWGPSDEIGRAHV